MGIGAGGRVTAGACASSEPAWRSGDCVSLDPIYFACDDAETTPVAAKGPVIVGLTVFDHHHTGGSLCPTGLAKQWPCCPRAGGSRRAGT